MLLTYLLLLAFFLLLAFLILELGVSAPCCCRLLNFNKCPSVAGVMAVAVTTGLTFIPDVGIPKHFNLLDCLSSSVLLEW
jgi:hypothetical protein